MADSTKQYIDITKNWLNNATPNSHPVLEARYFKNKDKVKYYVDNKSVVLDYSKKEKEVAIWLENTFGGELFLLPRINYPQNIKTPDYLYNGEYFDLKSISGSGKRVVDSLIKGNKAQAKNFIIDISSCPLSIVEILNQVTRIYNMKNRNWLDIMIIKKNNKLIAIYKRK